MIQGKNMKTLKKSNNMTPQMMPQTLYKEVSCKRHDNSLQLAHMKKKQQQQKHV